MDFTFKDIIEENKKLLDNLYKEEKEKEVGVTATTTIDTFRSKILEFIGNSLGQVQRTQALLDLVDAKIMSNLLLNEYDKKDLLQLRAELVQATNTKTSVLLDPFKPTNGSGNSLITPPSSLSEGESSLKDITPKERQALDKVYRILEMNKKKIAKDNSSNDDDDDS